MKSIWTVKTSRTSLSCSDGSSDPLHMWHGWAVVIGQDDGTLCIDAHFKEARALYVTKLPGNRRRQTFFIAWECVWGVGGGLDGGFGCVRGWEWRVGDRNKPICAISVWTLPLAVDLQWRFILMYRIFNMCKVVCPIKKTYLGSTINWMEIWDPLWSQGLTRLRLCHQVQAGPTKPTTFCAGHTAVSRFPRSSSASFSCSSCSLSLSHVKLEPRQWVSASSVSFLATFYCEGSSDQSTITHHSDRATVHAAEWLGLH